MKNISTYDFSNSDFAGWLQENIAADEIHLVGTVQREQLKPIDICFTQLQGKLVDISKLSIILPNWAKKQNCDFLEVFCEDLDDNTLSENFVEKLYINTDYATRFVFYNDFILSEDKSCLAAIVDKKRVIIPDGVTVVGNGACATCSKMSMVQFSNSVVKIGVLSFAYAANLQSVELPTSLRELSWASFYLCDNLKTVTLPEGIVEIPVECFRYSPIEEINFPSSLRAIRADAFHAGLWMDYVILPEGLEILESGAFATATGMIHLPSTLKQCDEDWYYDSIVGKEFSDVVIC